MLRRIILTVIVIGALGVFVLALNSSETETEPRFTDPAVREVFPAAGTIELRQSRIGVELDPVFTAVLFIDGVEIPEDQHEREQALGQVFYTPGVDKETGEMEPGRHCAAALIWRLTETREDGRRYSWCFNLN